MDRLSLTFGMRLLTRILPRRFCAFGASVLLLTGTPALCAQQLRVTVIDSANGRPVPGAIISILRSDGTRGAAVLGNELGIAILPVIRDEGREQLRLLIERVGYASASTLIQLSATPRSIEVQLAQRPLLLPTIAIKDRRTCVGNPTESADAASLWEEIRKALTATVVSARQSADWKIWRYTRALDLSLRVLSESTSFRTATLATPFVTASPDELSQHGFVRDTAGERTYYAPDAEVLLSESFVRTHCFGVRRPAGAEPLYGLSFQPSGNRRITDVAGVLWIEKATGQLRWMDYHYVTGASSDGQIAGGQIHFTGLPNGQWIVERWYIRMPALALIPRRQLTARLSAQQRDSLVGYREEGGWLVVPAVSTESAVSARLTGVIYDSLRWAPLAGVRVRLLGTATETVSDATGRYHVATPLSGHYVINFQHPRFRILGSESLDREITLMAGSSARFDLALPSPSTLTARACGAFASSNRNRLLVVHLFDSIGAKPLDARSINVSMRRMRSSRDNLGGAPLDTSVVARSDSSGIALVCGIRDAATFEVSMMYGGRRFAETLTSSDTSSLLEATIIASLQASVTSAFFGRVVTLGADSNPRPLGLAEVVVPALSISTRTQPDGSFELSSLPKGTHTVLVRSVGYKPAVARITLPLLNAAGHVIALSPIAPELAPMIVTGRLGAGGVMRGFEERRATINGASFLTRDDLAKREHSVLSDVLRSVRGLRIQRLPDGSNVIASSRGAFSFKIQDCFYQVFLDGIRIYAPGSRGPDGTTKPPNIDDFATAGIEAVEIYPGPATTPTRFSGLGAVCGTIVIWSRGS